jgi:hypothetical protein
MFFCLWDGNLVNFETDWFGRKLLCPGRHFRVGSWLIGSADTSWSPIKLYGTYIPVLHILAAGPTTFVMAPLLIGMINRLLSGVHWYYYARRNRFPRVSGTLDGGLKALVFLRLN